MYQYDINRSRMGMEGFTRKVPKKSKRYSLNRKTLEKKMYLANNAVSRSTLPKGDYTSGVRIPGNANIEQSDSSNVPNSTMSCVPLPPSISQEHFLGIIGELNKAFMKNNCNDHVSTTELEANPQIMSQFSNGNDIQNNSKFIGTRGTNAPLLQAPSSCISGTYGISCVSQNSYFSQCEDTFGLRQLERNINPVATIASQNACADVSGIINSNGNYIPHGNTSKMILSNSVNAGNPRDPCNANPMFPQTTIRAPVPQGMCSAVPTNYPCVENRLPYDCAMFIERVPQQNVWHGVQIPPTPSVMGFWDTQGTTCNMPFIQNMPNQDMNHLPNFPMLNYPVPYQATVNTAPGYQILW